MQEPQDPQASDEPTEDPSAALKAALATQVSRRIKEAIDARQASGIEEIWQEDADQYDGIDGETGVGTVRGVKDQRQGASDQEGNKRSKVVLNITKPKTDAAVARVQEMLVPHDDKPWEIGPTPIPELLEAADDNETVLTLADGTKAPASLVAKAAMQKATAASEKMADWIEDQFVEGSVYAEMRRVIRSAGRLGSGVLKGPFPVAREVKRWSVDQGVATLAVAAKNSPTSKALDVRDFFPDPACGENIHNGSYCVERDYMTARQLRALAKVGGYDRAAIVQALREGPRARGRDAQRFRDQPGESLSDSDVFELYYYYGDVEPETLLSMGVSIGTVQEEELYLAKLPAVVTMLNDRPIRATLNPLETGEFPFDVFVWDPIEGQPWGRGVPRKMAVAARMLNAAVRSLLENAGLSAGPQVAILEGALRPANGKYEITGRKLWKFTGSEFVDDIKKAMHVWDIPSAQKELAAIIDFALKMADELTNLPMLLQGQQGSAPDLLGGMKMLMANAAAPLRVIAKQYDDMLVVPHLRRYYDWGMQTGPAEARGDMQIKARGSTALVQREVAREFLIQAHQLAQRPNSRINPDKVDEEIFKSHGVSFTSISYTDDEWAQIQEAKKNQPQPQDPRIEAANIRAEVDRERLAADRERNAEDRALKRYVADIEFQIQAMEFAGQKEVSLADLKAMLAAKAIDSRDRRELFAAERALKMDPANPTRQGI